MQPLQKLLSSRPVRPRLRRNELRDYEQGSQVILSPLWTSSTSFWVVSLSLFILSIACSIFSLNFSGEKGKSPKHRLPRNTIF